MNIFVILLLLIAIILGVFIIHQCIAKVPNISALGGLAPMFMGGREGPLLPILNVFLDERNFYYSTQIYQSKDKYKILETLNKLRKYLGKKYPKYRIKMHIVTKNKNTIDYIDMFDDYRDRYDPRVDILYIANTTYDTEIISQNSKTHHLKGRDDFLILVLALEHMDKGEHILIISNDKYRDFPYLYQMPEFNMIRIDGNNIEKRHINPSKYRFYISQFKKIIENPELKISIPKYITLK